MTQYERDLERVCDALEKVSAILIGGGAGLSSAAGLDYSGSSFRREFADYIRKYAFTDLYTSGFYDFPTEASRWAYWARHIDFARFRPPALPLYQELFELARQRNYFVITTNVDGQFAKAGFSPQKIFAVQGDYGLMQCAFGCHPKVYSSEEIVRKILANETDCSIPEELVPKCPVCGRNMDINLRINNYFVEDEAWQEACARYEDFLARYENKPIVLLELGVGYNTPGIIRFPFERITLRNPRALLARVNRDHPACPKEIAARSVVFQNDIGEVVVDILKILKGRQNAALP